MHVTCSMCLNCELCMLFMSTIRETIFEEVFVVSPVLAYIIFTVIFPQLRRHLLDSNSSIFVENVGAFEAWRHLLQYMTFNYKNEIERGIHFCQPFDSATPKSSEKTWKISHNRPKERGVWRGGWRWSRGKGFSVNIIWFTESLLLHKMYLSYFYPWSVNLKVDMLRR